LGITSPLTSITFASLVALDTLTAGAAGAPFGVPCSPALACATFVGSALACAALFGAALVGAALVGAVLGKVAPPCGARGFFAEGEIGVGGFGAGARSHPPLNISTVHAATAHAATAA